MDQTHQKTGFVRAPQGERLGFTQVAVCETGATVVVNEHGLFQIPLPTDGVVSLVASDEDGRVARTKSFRPSRRSGKVPVADLVLEPGLSMRGYVRDEQGRPADGAIVIARAEHAWPAGARSTDEGRPTRGSLSRRSKHQSANRIEEYFTENLGGNSSINSRAIR